MAFGPAWNPGASGRHEAPRGEGLLAAVRSVAARLAADLEAAGAQTRAWSDRVLADALVDAALARCLRDLTATECWGEANRLPSSELWRIAGPWLERGVLEHRARFKPRGYAGDYEMLAWICQERCCGDPLGAALDRYFLRQAAPQAVRARTGQAAAMLAAEVLSRPEGAFRVTGVGSGPALDLRAALEMLPEASRRAMHVTLLDLDPDALESAQGGLAPLLPAERLAAERVNLFRMARMAGTAGVVGRPDFLACLGLFDYLDDEAAAASLGLFWRQLAPGGMLLVGNFSPHNPTRAYMEWVGNWYLTYRTAEELSRLAERSGIPAGAFSIACERLGVDLFVLARKPNMDQPLGTMSI